MKKRKIAVLIGLFACALLALGLAACGHQHTYGAGWTYDATHHWHEATCEHTGEKDGYAEHTWDNGTVTTAATCTEAGEKTYTCTACSATKTETVPATGHILEKEWTTSDTHHWHETCEHKTSENGYGEHTYNENNVCTVCGMGYVSAGLVYTLSEDGTYYSVTNIGTCTDTVIYIPSAHNGLPVTSIGYNAFFQHELIKSVFIPDSITSIGEGAFGNCYELTSVTIGRGVTSIGNYAFSGCHNLASIVIPNGVTSIGDFAFEHCNNLTSVTIRSGVTSIGEDAFAYCNSLTSVIIPDSVTSIGDRAFGNCYELTSVTIGNGVKSIGVGAFMYCNSLTSVIIPESVTSIGDMAFADCNTLVAVYYRGTATQWQAVTISSDSFVSTTTVYCYSETQPTDTGNYWHFDTDGVTPVKW